MKNDQTYQEFDLLNQEFTFDVDLSQLPCGLNGALYFVEMASDGGMSQYPANKAGAAYGTGYCGMPSLWCHRGRSLTSIRLSMPS